MASDIVITPNRGSTTVNAKIDFTGASTASSQIRLEVLPDNSLSFVGTTGSLFSIADSVTGSLMSVNDASGLPILEVFDTDKVVMGQYNQNTLVVNGTQVGIGTGSPTNKLTIAGVNSNGITLTGSNATITSAGTTPNLILSAGTNIYLRPTSGYTVTVDTGNGLQATTGDIRAPSFIDSADSTYSLDLNSTADTALRIRGGAVFGPNSTWSRYLMVGGNGRSNYTDNTQYASVTTTNGNLHLDAASGFNSYINWYDGTDLIVGAGDSSTERFRVYGSSNYTFASGEIRSPVFKDSADTAYYVDPNATSVLSKLSIGNAPYVSSIQAGALELGRTDTNYQYTSGWTGSMQGGILANCSDNWEFVIHDSGHRLASAFEFRGAGTNVMRLGRDLGWGVTPIEIPGNLTVVGNLTVNGTTTTVNSTTVTIDDPIFTLGGDTAPASDDNKDRGIEFRWHNGTAAKAGFFGFDDSTGYFTFIPDSTNTSEVFSGTQGDIQASNFRGNVVGGTVTVAGTLTINKSGTNSDIIFPAQANDPGYIRHYESNNTAIMYFNVSDDTNDEFHFGYTGDPSTFRLRSDGTVLEGIWQGSSITTTYTDAKVATLTGQSGRILIQGGVSASAQTLGLSIPVAFDQTLKNNARNITGGGTISVSASGEVKWSARFIIISGGRGANYATSGYWDIDCPTSGTITGVGGAANQTANANGIPMGGWQALYYILPIGSGNGSLAANFRLVHYSSDLDIPIDWVLICVRNSDTDTFYFPNGVVLGLGGASARGLQTSANTANAVVIRDGSGNFSAGTVTATQFNGSGAGLSSGTVPIASLVAGDYSSKITSGTYSINVTSADQIDGVAFRNTGSNAGTAADSLEQNGITYVNSNISLLGQTDGALFSQAYNSTWQHQIYGDYRTGQIVVRGKNNGTWQSWRTVLDSSNYTSYTGHIGNGTLTLNTSGSGISGSASFTANQSGAGTFTVTSNATSANTASTLVFRDTNGDFQARNITTQDDYTNGWFRNNSNNTGLYNQSTYLHLSSTGANTSYLDISTVGSTNSGIRFYTGGHVNTLRGYIVANTSNELMLWNAGGSYSARFTSTQSEIYQDTYVPTLYGNIMYDRQSTSFYVDPGSTSVLNRLNVAGYSMRSSATLDLSNTGTYSTTNYYPVTIPLATGMPTRMRIVNALNSNVPSWSTHGSGFTCHVEWTSNGSGWGTIAVQRSIHRYTEGYTNSTICGGITQMTNGSIEVIWLRGGGRYYFEADADVTPTIQSTTYTNNGQSVTPGSAPQNDVLSAATDTRPSFQRLNLTMSTGTAPMTVSSTTLVTNLNADLLDGYNSAETGSSIILRTQSNGYLNIDNWIQVGSAGLYSSVNSAHWTPNQSGSYSPWRIINSRGGYGGIYDDYSGVNWMHDSAGNGGIYRQGNGRWILYHNVANNCTSINGSNNTSGYGLYVNGNSYVSGYERVGGGNLYIDGNYGRGVVGLYNAARYQGVFAMGDSYKLADDGTTTGSLYGIAWSHPNAGGVAANLNTHGALVMENGTFLAAISGSIRCRDDMRAPRFYDSGDTNYYVDPASTSILNAVTATEIRSSRYTDSSGNFLFRLATGTEVARSINLADSTNDPATVVSNYGGTGITWGQHANPYYMIYMGRETYGGDYTKLTLAWHTGIKIGAYSGWGGVRFYNNSPFTGTEIFSVGKGDNHVRVENNLYVGQLIDISNSTYYVDPASSTRLNGGIQLDGSLGVGTAGSGTAGEIRATNNITAYYSDDRLKTKLGAIENPIEKVKSLSGFYFEANETAVALGYQKKREVGVSAQEVQAILPEIIAPAPIDDKYMTVRYEKLIPLLIEAIKEQQKQIEELKSLLSNNK